MATVTENTDGTVNIELGEDETGSLVALQIAERGNLGNQAGEVDYSVNLYLLPEGAEFPETREEGAGFGNVETYSYLNEITDDLCMQLVGSWDLGSTGSNEEDFNNGDGPMRI